MSRRWSHVRGIIVIVAVVSSLTLALETSVVLAQGPLQITITLVDEVGNPLASYPPAGNVNNLRARYRYGGTWASWQHFTTDANGQFVVQIDQAHRSQWDGKVTVVLHQNSMEQAVTEEGPNIFQAARVNVNLKSCGQLIKTTPGGTVSQGGWYWYTHGTTGPTGTVIFYTFPGSITLKMTYKGQSETKGSVTITPGINEVDFITPCIVINKTAVSGDATFGYTSTIPDNATFNITTAGGSGSQSFPDLAVGMYTVTEAMPLPNWSFTSLSCDDPDSGTTVNGQTANIDLDAGETVTCTYTNAYTPPTGTIVVKKDAVPDDPQDFEFSRSFGANFFLDDDSDGALSNTVTFTGVAAGTYTVTELGPPVGWTLTELVCDDPDSGSVVSLGERTATIDLDAGETVTCTFKNKTHDLVVTKTDDNDPAAINQLVTYTITATNYGPAAAPNVTVIDSLPANDVTFVSAMPSQGGPCSVAANVVTCPLGTIANGGSATVTIQVRYTTTGTKTNTVSASSTLPDLDPSNNLNREETTTVTQSPQPCPGVSFYSMPCRVTFRRVGERKLITVRVINRSGAPIQVEEFEPQAGKPFTIKRVSPPLPVTIPNRRVQWFSVIVQGEAIATVTKPYFYINTSCGVVTTASDPRLLVPMHLESLQAIVRYGHLHLEARGEGIESIQLQLFDLSGRKLIDKTSEGPTLIAPLLNARGRRLAQGVYLYTVTVHALDGTVVMSEVRKLAIKE